MKTTLIVIGLVLFIAIGFGVYNFTSKKTADVPLTTAPAQVSKTESIVSVDAPVANGVLTPSKDIMVLGARNATYIVNGQPITLKNGISELEIPNSTSKIVTKYFGNEVKTDLDGDGREDIAFILTQSLGGTGTFYFLVGALNTTNGFKGTEGVLLGDRIAPQTTEKGNGRMVIVNYAERALGESFAVKPSVGKSLWLLLDPKTAQFGEVAQDFEGEADPSKMTLGMKTWNWVTATYSNDTAVTLRTPEKFTLSFAQNGTFSATTDCNNVSGVYNKSGNKISFGKIASTKMFCDGSQESEFTKLLSEVDSYSFTGKGELILDLKLDSGSVVFR